MACEGDSTVAHTGATNMTFNSSFFDFDHFLQYQEPVITPTESTARDGLNMPNTMIVYGGTAMLSLHQCVTGDVLSINMTGTADEGLMSVTTVQSGCVLFIAAPAGVLASSMKAAFDRVRFTQTRKDRAQITFSFIFWSDPNVPNLLTDPETNNAYTLFDFTTAKDWVHTGLACRGLGPDWSLITVNSRTEAAIAATHVATLGRLPLSMDRSSGAWKWVNSDPITYMGWGAGQPAGTANACAEVSATGEWVNADCSLLQYQWAVCESTIPPFGYSVPHVRNATTDANVEIATIFTSTMLPPDSVTTIYGATAHTVSNVTECYTDDAFHLSATVKYITLVREGPCMLMFGGVTTTQNYNRLFLGLQFTGRYPYRRQIAFAAVYWTTAQMRELMVEAVSGKVYNTYTMNWRWDPTTHGDVWYPLSGHCALMGMDPASITNRLASTEQLRTRLGSTNMLIGAVRATATSFKWTYPSSGLSDATVVFQEWFATEPNTANDCTVHTGSHSLWTTVDCATQVPTIACSRESHGAVFNTGPLPLSPRGQQATRWLAPTSPYSSVNLTLDLTHVRDDLVVHGATLHIAEPQCDGSDVLFLPTATSKWPAVTMEYRAAACALFMSSPMTAIDYKQMLSEVVLNTTAIRPMTSFVWIFWMDATLRDMLMDVETRVVYSYLAVASNVTWQQAYADCRLAGSTWRMASPLFAHEQDTARGFIDSILTEGPLPIAASNIYTSPSYQWLTEERMSFVDWAENEPFTSMAGKACVELTHDLGLTTTVPHWAPADCVDPRYHRVFCESRTYEFAGVHNFIADLGAYPPVSVSNPIPQGVLPAVGLNEVIYGATVEVSPDNCVWSDRFMPTLANDLIVVAYDAGCMIEFAGEASVGEYNMVLSMLGWRAAANTRPMISYSYVYWPSPYARGLRVAVDTLLAFTAVPSTTYEASPASYNYITADAFCALGGLQRAEVAGLDETAAVNRTTRYGQPLLAKLEHDTGDCALAQWAATAHPANYSRWDANIDLCDNTGVGGETDICAVTNADTNWTRVQCAGATPTRVPAVACRAVPNSVKLGVARKTFGITYIYYDALGHLTVTGNAFMNLANDTVLERVFLQLAITQCKSGDTFVYRFSTLPTGFALSMDATRCRMSITGAATVDAYRQLMSDIVFMSTDKGRVHLVFAVTAARVASLRSMWVDPQTSFTYASVALGSAKSWNDVHAICPGLGTGWSLADPPSELANPMMPDDVVPIYLRRAAAGTGTYVVGASARPVTYNNFEAPPYSGGQACGLAASVGAHRWGTINCSTPYFTTALCMHPTYTMTERVVQIIDPADVGRTENVTMPVSLDSLPTDSSQLAVTVYGATVTATLCRLGDVYFPLTTPDDKITIYRSDCTMLAAGETIVARYNDLMAQLEFRTMGSSASLDIVFGYLYWTHPLHFHAVLDLNTRTLYTSISGGFATMPSPSEVPAGTLCTANDFSIAEPRNATSAKWIRDVVRRPDNIFVNINCTTSYASPRYCSDLAPANLPFVPMHATGTGITYTLAPTMEVFRGSDKASAVVCTKALEHSASLITNTTQRTLINFVPPPTPATRFAVPGAFGRYYPLASALAGIPGRMMLYGFRVMLSHHQCHADPAKRVAIIASASLPTGAVVAPFGMCAHTVHGAAFVTAYNAYVSTLGIAVPAGGPDAIQYHVSYIFYTQVLSQGPFFASFLDADTASLYAWTSDNMQLRTIEEATGICGTRGYGWNIARFDSAAAEELVWSTAAPDIAAIPVAYYRTSPTLFNWSASSTTPSPYAPWAVNQPDNLADRCVRSMTEGWDDTSCNNGAYTRFLCRNDEPLVAPLVGFVALVFDGSSVPQSGNATHFVDPHPDTAAILYGVTVQLPLTLCHSSDRFWLSVGRDEIVVSLDTNCLVMLSGKANGTIYNLVTDGLVWRTSRPGTPPTSMVFGHIYWTQRGFRDLTIDPVRGLSYFPLMLTNYFRDGMLKSTMMCSQFNYTLAELLTAGHFEEARRVPWNVSLTTGARKSAAGAVMRWPMANQDVASSVAPWTRPEEDDDMALAATFTNKFQPLKDGEYVRGVLCVANAYVAPPVVVANPPTPPPATPTRSRTDTYTISKSLVPTPAPTTLAPTTTDPRTTKAPTDATDPPTGGPVTRPPETPAPPPFVANVQLQLTVKKTTPVRKGDVIEVGVEFMNGGMAFNAVQLKVSVPVGLFMPLNGCGPYVMSAVRGYGFTTLCADGGFFNTSGGRAFSFYIVAFPDVELPPRININASIAVNSDWTTVVANASASLSTFGASSKYTIQDFDVGLNDVGFGDHVHLVGTNLSNMPSRQLLGPFIASITSTAQTADVSIPPVSAAAAALIRQCPRITADEARQAAISMASTPEDKVFIDAMLTEGDLAILVGTFCLAGTRHWDPSHFTLGARVYRATNFTGLTFAFRDHLNQPIEFFEAGAPRTVRVFVPAIGNVRSVTPKLTPEIAFEDSATTVEPLIDVSTVRRQVEQLTEDRTYETTVHVNPLRRTAIEGRVVLTVPDMLQRWALAKSIDVRLPGVNLTKIVNNENLFLKVDLGLRNGTRLVSPTITFFLPNPVVSVDFGQAMAGCNVSAGEYLVRCGYDEVSVLGHGVPNVVTTGAQALVPPYYAGDVNISVTVNAANINPVTVMYTLQPTIVPAAPRTDTTAAPSSNTNALYMMGIFNSTEQMLHFLVYTFATFFVLLIGRTIWYVYRRRYRPAISFSVVDIEPWKAIIKQHVWIGLVWPCHYRCANIHITLAMCTVMGMYTIVSLFYVLSSRNNMAEWHFHLIVGSTAALAQAALRPLFSFGFYWFSTHDETEVLRNAVKMESEDLSDDMLAPAVYDAFDSFGKEDITDLLAPTSGFDGDILVDDALRANAPADMQFGGTFGVHEAVAGLGTDGLDWAPVDLDDDILIIDDDETKKSAAAVNPDDIDFAFASTQSSGTFVTRDSRDALGFEVADTLNLEDVDFSGLLDDSEPQPAGLRGVNPGASTASSATVASFGAMADRWHGSATAGSFTATGSFAGRPMDKRAQTLVGLSKAMDAVEGMSSQASETYQTETFGDNDNDSEDYYEGVAVTRQLGNMRIYAYAMTATFIALCAAATFSITRAWNREELTHFWWTMLVAFVADFCIVEFMYAGLVALYRWLTIEDEADGLMNELHPYEGEEEVRIF
jgi:hypothetical protein